MKSRFGVATINGLSMPYRVYGQDPLAAQVVTVFVPGIGMSGRLYRRLATRIASLGSSVIVPLQPGCVGTVMPDQLTVGVFAADTWKLVDSLVGSSTKPVLLMGHSLGACTAIEMIVQQPGRVDRVIALNAVGGPAWREIAGTVEPMHRRSRRNWLIAFARELFVRGGLVACIAMGTDFFGNFLRRPKAMWRMAEMARCIDISASAASLQQTGVPIDTVWSKGDWFVTGHARESLCDALGGTVRTYEISGAHGTGTMLADPVVDALRPVLLSTFQHLREKAALSSPS